MRVGQKFHIDHQNDKLIVETLHDYSETLESVKQIKAAGIDSPTVMSDSKHVGRIPMDMLTQWIKEAGLQWTDHEAVRDLVRTKMLSGDFEKFRVWEGSY